MNSRGNCDEDCCIKLKENLLLLIGNMINLKKGQKPQKTTLKYNGKPNDYASEIYNSFIKKTCQLFEQYINEKLYV